MSVICLFFTIVVSILAYRKDANAAADDNSYQLEFKYQDSIQIRYQHKVTGSDIWWTGNGDIPMTRRLQHLITGIQT
jgi:hypothetical protein